MSCQGCGRISETRLCCPTCIEFGRTSFFCGQECFTKNWHAHNQLHELLRRKKGAADGNDAAAGGGSFGVDDSASADAGAPAVAGDALGGGSSGSSLPLPRARDTREDSGSVMAPLPGGTSLLSGIHKRDRSAQRSSREAPRDPEAGGQPGDESKSRAGSGPSMLGSWVNQARARFTGGGSAEPSRQTAEAARRPGRSRSPAPSRAGQKAAPPSRTMTMQTGIWGLVVLTITAGGLFYREHLRFAEDQESPAQAAFLGSDLSKPSEGEDGVSSIVKTEDGTEISVIVPAESAGKAGTEGASALAPVSSEAAGQDSVASLRSEVASLRQSLQRHEQMLRYIMDRYVEKKADQPKVEGPSIGGIDVPVAEAHGHDVAAVTLNMSVPEFQSKGFTDVAPSSAEAGSGDNLAPAAVAPGGRGPRKRSGGLDAVDVPGLGM